MKIYLYLFLSNDGKENSSPSWTVGKEVRKLNGLTLKRVFHSV